MNFGSIIGFIAIAIISSLFNKDKKVVKPSVQPSRTIPTQRSIKRVDSNSSSNQETVINISNTGKSRRRTFTGGLEDLFKELKVEFDRNVGHTESSQEYSNSAQNTLNNSSQEKKDHSSVSSKIIQSEESKQIKGSVYAGEIGKDEIPIEFNRKSIIQGVIMSEVLQKPKSLRR